MKLKNITTEKLQKYRISVYIYIKQEYAIETIWALSRKSALLSMSSNLIQREKLGKKTRSRQEGGKQGKW